MKSASTALSTVLNAAALSTSSQAFFITELFTITLTNGNVLTLTTWDRDITYLGVVYSASSIPAGPYIKRGPVKTGLGLQVSTMDLTIAASAINLVGTTPILQAAWRGDFDNAQVLVTRLISLVAPTPTVPFDLTNGTINVFLGNIADINNITRLSFDCVVKSPLQLLSVQLPRQRYGPGCRFTLFDSACGVNKATLTVNGHITTASTLRILNTSLSPSASVSPPTSAPSLSQNGSSAISTPQQSVWVVTTYNTALGETSASVESTIVLGKNHLLTVASPPSVTEHQDLESLRGLQSGIRTETELHRVDYRVKLERAKIPLRTGQAPPSNNSLGYYAQGVITFTSGTLNGQSFTIKGNTGGSLTLYTQSPGSPATSDTFADRSRM